MQQERFLEWSIVPLLNYFVYNNNTINDTCILNILHVCNAYLPSPSSKDLKTTKVGKLVNKLAKYNEGKVKDKASEVVDKWKKGITHMKADNIKPAVENPTHSLKDRDRKERDKKQYKDMKADNSDSSYNRKK